MTDLPSGPRLRRASSDQPSVDDAHSADAQRGENLVMRQAGADHRWGGPKYTRPDTSSLLKRAITSHRSSNLVGHKCGGSAPAVAAGPRQ